MKRLIVLLFFITQMSIAADSTLFTGTWLVEEEGISISFADSGKVSYDSDDESVVGEGIYSYDDTTLTAEIKSDDMDMKITYHYMKEEDNLKVKTLSVVVNGDTLNNSDEWYEIVREDTTK